MRRAATFLLLSALALVVPAVPATAAGGCTEWVCEDTSTTVIAGGGGGGSDHDIPGTGGTGYAPAFAPAGPETVALLELLGTPSGSCWQAVPSAGSPMTYYQAQLAALRSATPEQPACPDLDTLRDPRIIRRTLWEEVDPPAPSPSVDPGKGITGLPVYLTIDGPREQVFEVTLGGQTFQLPATATYDIYWDWPRTSPSTRGVDRNGVTYEERHRGEEITWTYRQPGRYTIRVEAVWRLTGDPDAAAKSPAGQVGLDVREVQAVRRR